MSTAQRQRKKRKESKKRTFNPKILIYILVSIILSFLIYRGIVLVSFKVDCSTISSDVLSKDSSMIIDLFVFEDNGEISNIEVFLYSKDRKNILKLEIPTDIYVSQESVDEVPISSLEQVGEFLKFGTGKQYTIDYLSDLLGIKFDNYVWLVDSSKGTDDFLGDLSVWSILWDFRYNTELHGHIYSNLPILNLISHVNLLNTLSNEYIDEVMDISECCVKDVVISGDIKRVHFDKGSFDIELNKYLGNLVSNEIEKERVNVEVYNASDISGLASTYARKIRHTGCRILRFDNAPVSYDKTLIYIPEPEEYSQSLNLIRDVLGKGIEVVYGRPTFITTGDIVVVLGKDISN
jgi:hypothetical protein